MEGVDEPVVHAGAVVATRKRYSDAILVTLLKRADAAEAARAGLRALPTEELRERLDRRIARMKAAMEAEDEAEASGK